jgi:hypothetical protein
MDPETTTKPSLWNTKQEDMTVGDGVKLSLGLVVVTTIAPLVVLGVAAGCTSLWRKIRGRKPEEAQEAPKETDEEK